MFSDDLVVVLHKIKTTHSIKPWFREDKLNLLKEKIEAIYINNHRQVGGQKGISKLLIIYLEKLIEVKLSFEGQEKAVKNSSSTAKTMLNMRRE